MRTVQEKQSLLHYYTTLCTRTPFLHVGNAVSPAIGQQNLLASACDWWKASHVHRAAAGRNNEIELSIARWCDKNLAICEDTTTRYHIFGTFHC
jgi:hypothetical protein